MTVGVTGHDRRAGALVLDHRGGIAGEVVQREAVHWPDAPPKSAWPGPHDAEARHGEPSGERIELAHVPAE